VVRKPPAMVLRVKISIEDILKASKLAKPPEFCMRFCDLAPNFTDFDAFVQ
jgi:hypothetical protein